MTSRAARLFACSAGLCAIAAIAGCANHGSEVMTIRYRLPASLVPDVERIETAIAIDETLDPRRFTEDVPFQSLGVGVGYEVRDFRGNGAREVHVVHDVVIGFVAREEVVLRLGRPMSAPPALRVTASVRAGGRVVSTVGPSAAVFGGDDVVIAFDDPRCGGVFCAEGFACCDGHCLDVSIEATACGGCDHLCAAGETCSASHCSCAGGSPCAAGQGCCAGLGCVDTTMDAQNCGGCGVACAPGEACVASACACGTGAACPAGQLCCDGACTSAGGCSCGGNTCDSSAPICCTNNTCTNTQSSAQNCGACGKSCAAPLSCVGGQCKCEGQYLCAAGDACCPGAGCRSLNTDAKHCGMCGKACGPAEQCIGGTCKCVAGQPATATVCAPGETCCPGLGFDTGCRNLLFNQSNCGMCGKSCTSGIEGCVDGSCDCFPPCGALHCCLGQGCFDTDTDEAHCGSSCNACNAGDECRSGNCYTP